MTPEIDWNGQSANYERSRRFPKTIIVKAKDGLNLTSKLLKIFQLRAEGADNPMIARRLGLSLSTVENQINRAVDRNRKYLKDEKGKEAVQLLIDQAKKRAWLDDEFIEILEKYAKQELDGM